MRSWWPFRSREAGDEERRAAEFERRVRELV